MPSALFAALAQDASAAVDEVMAEAWQLRPRAAAADVNAPDGPDGARAAVPVTGTFVDPEAKPDLPNSYDRRQVRRPGEETGHPRVLVSPAAVSAMALAAAALGKPASIRQGDHLLRDADGILWRVASVFPMAGGTLKVSLNIAG